MDEMGVRVIGFGFLFRRHCVMQVVQQFRNFQSGHELAGLHPVAEIHLHFADVTGNLRVQFHFFIRTKLPRNCHLLVEVFTRHFCHARRRRGVQVSARGGLRARAMCCPQPNQAYNENRCQDFAEISETEFYDFEFHSPERACP